MPQFSTGLFHWWALILIHAFIKLHAWLLLIRVWCITCWEWTTNVTLVKVLVITSVYYLQGKFHWIPVWSVTGWPLFADVSHTPKCCTHPFGQKRYISASICSHKKNIIHVGLFNIWLHLMLHKGWQIEWLRNFIPMSIWKSLCMFCKFPTSLW